MTGLTKKQLDWCNNLIKGENRTEAARRLGFHGVRFTDPHALRAELGALELL